MARKPKDLDAPLDNPLTAVAVIDAPHIADTPDAVEYADDFQYFSDYVPAAVVQNTLPFRPGTEHIVSAYSFRFFRPEEHPALNGGVKCAYWRTVKKDL